MSSQRKNLNKAIPVSVLPKDEKIKFSFEYYDVSNKYCLSSWSEEQIKRTLTRLKDISTKSFKELNTVGRSVYHFGEVIWERTKEPRGFPDPRLANMEAFHFALLGVNGQLARVFGAYYAEHFISSGLI